jgi:hypothetical protein
MPTAISLPDLRRPGRPMVPLPVKIPKDRATAEAKDLRPLLAPMVASGYSLRRIGEALAKAGTETRTGSPLSASGVKNLLQRLELTR